MASKTDALKEMVQRVLVPLVEADGGVFYLVALTEKKLVIHLAGRCGGCPGATLTAGEVITPAARKVLPDIEVQVTTGWLVPDGATRLSTS